MLWPPEETKGVGKPLGDVEGLGNAEGLSDGGGLDDGPVVSLNECLGEGEGDGEAVAETGSAWH